MSSRVCCPYCYSEDIYFEPYGNIRTDGKTKYRDTINYCNYCGEHGDFCLGVRVLVKEVKLEPTPLSSKELELIEKDQHGTLRWLDSQALEICRKLNIPTTEDEDE